MSGDRGKAESDLKREILERGYRFDFFQLIHLLETWQDREVGIGRDGPYRREGLRLRPHPSLAFSPADVRRVERLVEGVAGDDDLLRVTVTFMGLYGIASPSPVYLTELIGFTDVDAEPLVDLLDLFNHRILSLFYRAWTKYRFPYRYRPGRAVGEGVDLGGEDAFSSYVFSFVGLGEKPVRGLAQLPATRLAKYLGLLTSPTRPPANLELLLSDYFGGVEVRVRPWILRWVPIPPAKRNRLGAANSRLGVDLAVGERVPDRAGKFRIALGPLGFGEYLEFLPDGEKFRQLCALVHLWVGERYDFDVELILRREEIPDLRLEPGPGATRLGWTSWVSSGPALAENPSIIFPKKHFELPEEGSS